MFYFLALTPFCFSFSFLLTRYIYSPPFTHKAGAIYGIWVWVSLISFMHANSV